MKTLLCGLTVLAALTLVACGEGSSSDISASYTYSFNVNGCDTGKRTFKTLEAYCDGLQNQTLNKYCALEARDKAFRAQCQNQSFQPYNDDGGFQEKTAPRGPLEDLNGSSVPKRGSIEGRDRGPGRPNINVRSKLLKVGDVVEYELRSQPGEKVRVSCVEKKDPTQPGGELTLTVNSNLTIHDGEENVFFRCY